MSKGAFATLAASLVAANREHDVFDHAVLMAKTSDDKSRARNAMKDAQDQCDRISAALAVTLPDSATDALRLVALAQCWTDIVGDALGDDSPAEAEYQNLRRALDRLSDYVFATIPKAQRKAAVLGFRSYMPQRADKVAPREAVQALEREQREARTAAAAWLNEHN